MGPAPQSQAGKSDRAQIFEFRHVLECRLGAETPIEALGIDTALPCARSKEASSAPIRSAPSSKTRLRFRVVTALLKILE